MFLNLFEIEAYLSKVLLHSFSKMLFCVLFTHLSTAIMN